MRAELEDIMSAFCEGSFDKSVGLIVSPDYRAFPREVVRER